MSLISVIVPVYNTEKYLPRCIDSILAQTFTDFELILVDDGSPDNCGTICDEYAEKDSRVTVIHQINAGQGAARNKGIQNSSGDWICFIDSDDAVHPQMLEWMFQKASSFRSDIISCSYLEADQPSRDFFKPLHDEPKCNTVTINEESFLDLQNTGVFWIVCAKILNRSVIGSLLFTEGRYYEDNAVVCKWLYRAKAITIVDYPFYYYQVNPTGTTKSPFSVKSLDYLWALREQIAFFDSLNYDKMLNETLNRYFSISNQLFYKTKDELGNLMLAKDIRKNERILYKKYCRSFVIPPIFKKRLLKKYFPYTSKAISKCKNAAYIFKKEGIKGVVNKLFKR